jgi:hypothetical protein
MNISLDDAALREADARAVIDNLVSAAPLDPEVERRVRLRSQRATEQVRRRLGIVNVAVDLIRETRNDE